MAQKAIREFDAKSILAKHWDKYFPGFTYAYETIMVQNGSELTKAAKEKTWLKEKALVAKPDMLFGKRGKNGLVLFRDSKPGDVSLAKATSWIDEKSSTKQSVSFSFDGDTPTGEPKVDMLTHFIVEPFTPHSQEEEYYISATCVGDDDVLYMSAEGGMEVEENWDKVVEVKFPITATEEEIAEKIKKSIPKDVAKHDKDAFAEFAIGFFKAYRELNFAYLEINPFVLQGKKVELLDMVAKLDDTAGFMMRDEWGDVDFPTSFGMEEKSPEVLAIEDADSKSGASLKLTILKPEARIWTMVAGGGASVVYADTIADLAGIEDLANYGEYSGGPTTSETKFYAETILDLMTRSKDAKGRDKVLIIGGAIANFTDVAKTFTGIIQAFDNYADKMKKVGIKIYVRRGGPNYEKGLKDIKEAADRLGLYIEVYGPETHVTDIVRMALAK
ncbi:MAG: ATPase [Sulfurimonas sp. RIFCSPHIGHO2_12_FULL_36_9]|jgi:ATP-citrate lyase beta-subunit|uniref:ATP citrate lyase citrate-binding domain-containing protein n=1 Tax=Sulfurimonas sp. RIFCSPLOWO2_12_36_12 TaxID=1802253 RepID=UPI0008C96306|nr:ATP citrate lyase citrate-binding domain-containing protein [Sulfurimonas sp. RIFCSPLOWO2_12_36_12]OHD98725.1 MAG: ATPase [Sulfurimonas sp. RIFCSPHIGHO2_12_FULL_36_9]OHE00815.1 MAG: ATPase [Sulfurimonas sp. RIFCSPLOWO2_02_FULL_36_28]OHE02536.1 MAG: ATPase [Sulfurimonas sp. RIFCSPLOWO2_12_36_12]OHE07680.1 MAG: ATPase [Sulfurimonas sp. RIFCSPLOWO2_12_FULL_36_74]